jgi:hypothetical protein
MTHKNSIPIDCYFALRISESSDESKIQEAYEHALMRATRSRLWGIIASVCGQSPASLDVARAILMDPKSRKAHDENLDNLRVMFWNPFS